MTDSWDEVLDWERWAREVLTDWRVPFDNHRVGLRLGITQELCDLRDERDAPSARLAGTQDLYVQACEQRDDALALLTKVSLRKSCEGTQPYICHGLATARARLAEAVALLDSCEATGSEEWERRAAALVAECGPNARVTVSAEPRENDAHG